MTLFDWAKAQDETAPAPTHDSSPTSSAENERMTSLLQPRVEPSTEMAIVDGEGQTACVPDAVANTPCSTFSEALALLKAEGRIPPRKLYRWESDVACVAKLVGARPETLPQCPGKLVPLLEAVKASAMPGRKRLTHKRWSSMQSSLRSVARAVGLIAPKRSRHTPSALGMAWQPRLEALSPRHCPPLKAFIRWCDARGIGPAEVTEGTLEDYGNWRAANTYTKRLPAILRDIRMAWNGMQRRMPDWPQRRLASPAGERRNARLPETAFPSTFQADLASYLAGLRAMNPLEGRGKALAEPTIRLYRSTVMQAATIRASQLGGPEAVADLACLVTPEALRPILLHRHAVDGNAWRATSMHLAGILVGIAKDHVRLCPADLEQLRALRRRVSPTQPGRLPEKVRDRLAQFDDPRLRKDLFKLADELCKEAELMRAQKPFQAAAHHRRGILLHILLRSALRRRNLISLHLEEDFLRDHSGKVCGIRVRRTKNGITVQAEFPPALVRLFERHLMVFRPRLPGATSPWLIPSLDGTTHGSIEGHASALAKIVQKRLGADFNVHLARHLVATILYEQEGDNSVLTQRILGHTEVKSTQRMYGELSTAGAHHQWGKTIDRIVDQRARRQRKGGKG